MRSRSLASNFRIELPPDITKIRLPRGVQVKVELPFKGDVSHARDCDNTIIWDRRYNGTSGCKGGNEAVGMLHHGNDVFIRDLDEDFSIGESLR